MSEQQHLKSDMETLRQRFAAFIGPSVGDGCGARHPMAEKLARKLTPYAAHIVRAQAAQSMLYKRMNGQDLPIVEDGYVYIGINAMMTTTFDDDNSSPNGVTPQWYQGMDHGLNDGGVAFHVSSWKSCSCQFPSCYQLPCRHMFHAMFLNPDIVGDIVVGDLWLRQEELPSKRPANLQKNTMGAMVRVGKNLDAGDTQEQRKITIGAACRPLLDRWNVGTYNMKHTFRI